jgi:acetyltransferase-like isoleucine patch superfamily enzyme
MARTRSFLTKVRLQETPFYASLYRLAKGLSQAQLPVPNLLRPLFRSIYHMHFAVRGLYWRVLIYFYRGPIFRARCDLVGKGLAVNLLPDVPGHLRLILGDNVHLNGFFGVSSSRLFEKPTLRMGNNVHVGHMVSFIINKEVVIEDGVMIANYCHFADTDAHPTDPERRVAGAPPLPEEVKPVRICRNAWIGYQSLVLKGVTVGEGAIVAAGSVIVKDVPPFALVAGNTSRIVVENILSRAAEQAAQSSRNLKT